MVPQGEWMVNELISSKTDVNWEVAPMPIDDGEDAGTTVGQYQFVSISSSCSHPEEAYTFMQFLCGKEGAEIYAQNAILPAYQDADITEAYLKITGKESHPASSCRPKNTSNSRPSGATRNASFLTSSRLKNIFTGKNLWTKPCSSSRQSARPSTAAQPFSPENAMPSIRYFCATQ
jgi:ABC-type glycerol-3-phosphate transport system substrate-binding protein